MTIHDLPSGRARDDGRAFLARWIDDVVRSRIRDDETDQGARSIRNKLESRNRTAKNAAPLPQPRHDLWRGITIDGELVAVAHTAPPWGQAVDVSSREACNPDWLARYLNRCWNVEEIAVHPEHRRSGYAAALLDDLQNVSDANGVRTLSAYAGSDAAVALFVANGWTALPPRTPLPSTLAVGLRTVWHHVYDSRGGAWVFRRSDETTAQGDATHTTTPGETS